MPSPSRFTELPREGRVRRWSRHDLRTSTVVTACPEGVTVIEREAGTEARATVVTVDQVRALLHVVPVAERDIVLAAWSWHIDCRQVDTLIASVLGTCARAAGGAS